ncbi:MAG: hypothetical protein CMO55_23105 [Verrucomicrobiales bacterium]|nr:hypothetical protein [Verrucomicrobiales bacterium]
MSRKNSRSGKNHRNLVAGDREVDRIKAEFDMVAFVRELGFEITLSESGGMICCPFHDDRTPSCWVQPDHFFCFGCEAVGDVFEFLKRLRNLPFRNSLIYIKSCLARGFCRLT